MPTVTFAAAPMGQLGPKELARCVPVPPAGREGEVMFAPRDAF